MTKNIKRGSIRGRPQVIREGYQGWPMPPTAKPPKGKALDVPVKGSKSGT